jgi:CHAT domain-containing protein
VRAPAVHRDADGPAAREEASALVIRAEMRRSQASVRLLDRVRHSIARPVLDLLPERGSADGELPRLWWCPTGLATYLPLHAAGARRGRPQDCVPAQVVPSYAPTLTSLIHARRPVTATPSDRGLLLLTVPEPDLPEVAAEAAVVTGHLPDLVPLHDTDATVDAVTRLLPRHRHLHAVCHGIAREGMRLSDGSTLAPLQLSRIPAVDPGARQEADRPALPRVLHGGGHMAASEASRVVLAAARSAGDRA